MHTATTIRDIYNLIFADRFCTKRLLPKGAWAFISTTTTTAAEYVSAEMSVFVRSVAVACTDKTTLSFVYNR